MQNKWFDNQSGLVDFIKEPKVNGYESLTFPELAECLRKEEIALFEHKKHYANTWDIESSKAMKRCTNRIRVIKQYISKIDNFGINETMEKEFKEREWKLKNLIKNHESRIARLLKEVERYKKLADENLKKIPPIKKS